MSACPTAISLFTKPCRRVGISWRIDERGVICPKKLTIIFAARLFLPNFEQLDINSGASLAHVSKFCFCLPFANLHFTICSTLQHNTTHHYTALHITTQHYTTQHNTTLHNTTQHNTTQQNIILGRDQPYLIFQVLCRSRDT